MLIDSHAHLDDERFDEDRNQIVKELEQNDISLVINPGADLATSLKAVALSEGFDNIYAAVGVHPHDVKDITEDTIKELRKLSKNKKVVAIGEIGLDYYYDNSPRELQKKWFREQIKLAKELDLPIIIHDRDAHGDIFDIISDEFDNKLRGVLHCYSGSVELAKEFMKMGFYISLGGPVTFKNAKTPKEVAVEIPLEYLLVETDSPYLTPEPYRGKRNQPMYVKHVAEKIAELRGVSYEDIARITVENTKKLFNIRL